MTVTKITLKEAVAIINQRIIARDKEIIHFLLNAPTIELQGFIHEISTNDYSDWFKRAKVALEIRLAEEAAKTAGILIQHTELLTQQTDKLLNESASLTKLTKQLTFWTIIIGIFAAVQIVIMIIELFKHW